MPTEPTSIPNQCFLVYLTTDIQYMSKQVFPSATLYPAIKKPSLSQSPLKAQHFQHRSIPLPTPAQRHELRLYAPMCISKILSPKENLLHDLVVISFTYREPKEPP